MSGVYTVERKTKAGEPRYHVKYRVGGRGSKVMHAGVFKTPEEADARESLVRSQLAAGVLEIAAPAATEAPSHKWVYFIQQGKNGPIKIGVTWNVDVRLKNLQTASPRKLYLRAKIPRIGDEEAWLHGVFAGSRLRGEWFSPSPELLAYIEELRRL